VGPRGHALVLVALFLVLAPAAARAQPAVPDPALCLPGFADALRDYGNDWEQRVHPSLRPLVVFQRAIGVHALAFGLSGDPHPSLILSVTYWDGTDLYAAGLPRTYDGKPVVVRYAPDIPRAAVGYPPGQEPASGPLIPWRPGCPDPGRAVPLAGAPDRLPRVGGVPVDGPGVLAALLIAAGARLRGRPKRDHARGAESLDSSMIRLPLAQKQTVSRVPATVQSPRASRPPQGVRLRHPP
jgi:hypothetical protein